MHYSWVKRSVFLATVFLVLLVSFNMYIDPNGIISLNGKFTKFTCYSPDTPKTINDRINAKSDYYLLGTSRLMRVDPNIVSKLINKSVSNVHINGAMLLENKLIVDKVKRNNKNFIMGFDVFTNNKARLDQKRALRRYKMYKAELEKDFIFPFEPFISIDYLYDSIEHLYYNFIKRDKVYWLERENNKDYTYDIIAIKNKIINGVFYEDYKVYSKEFIVDLAKNTTENDIFVLMPKHVMYYKLFQEIKDIEKKYFKTLRILVNNTNAKVVSFYGVNEITKYKKNFDKNGWHFKPKFTKVIYKDLFAEDLKYGVILTKDNIDRYLSRTSNEISFYNEGTQ